MNRRSRPIASEQGEVAKRDQNVSLGDVEETETSQWLHIYPAAVQRHALFTLMPALGCSDTVAPRRMRRPHHRRQARPHLRSLRYPRRAQKPGFMIYVACETLLKSTQGRS